MGGAFVTPLLKDILPGAEVMSYFLDILNILLFILALNKIKCNSSIRWNIQFLLMFLLLVFDIIELIIYKQGILLFLWGMRNQYRFLLFFVSCVILCEKEDIIKIDLFMRKFLIINFIVVAIELMFGCIQDSLSGTFGITAGSNGSANLFLCVCFISLLIDYIYGRLEKTKMILYGGGILIWVALAELKYFVLLVAIMIISALIISKNKKNKSIQRKFSIAIWGVLGGILCILLLEYFRPYYKNFFSIQNIIWYTKNIDIGSGGFGRLTAVSIINKIFFHNNIIYKLFGIGLGSAEYASMDFLNSPFHKLYGGYKYDTLFYAMIYIERGIIGLIWYSVFYLNTLKNALTLRRRSSSDKFILNKVIICVIIIFCLSIYDDSLRRASGGFIMFFILAIPMILKKNNNTKEREYDS